MMRSLILGFILTTSAVAQTAPVWVKVANEGAIVTSAKVINYRFGTATGTTTTGVDCTQGGCWSPIITATLTQAHVTNASTPLFVAPDPAPGLAKELDVQQTTSAQTLIVSGATKTVPPLGTTKMLNITCHTPVTIDSSNVVTVTGPSTCTAVAQ